MKAEHAMNELEQLQQRQEQAAIAAYKNKYRMEVGPDGKRRRVPIYDKVAVDYDMERMEFRVAHINFADAPKPEPAPAEEVPAEMQPFVCKLAYKVANFSCGVREISGFSYSHSTVLDCFKDLIKHIKEFYVKGNSYIYQRPGNHYPAGTFIWSDRIDGLGTRFGDWLALEFRDNPPLCIKQVNPASGREIATFMWAPPASLKDRPEWKSMYIPKDDPFYKDLPRR